MTAPAVFKDKLVHNKKAPFDERCFFVLQIKIAASSKIKTAIFIDYSFSIKNLSEEQLIKYSDVIVYLMLKNKQYVAYDSLSKKFPNFTRPVFSTMIQDFKEIFGEDIYKDEYQSYIIDEII